MNNTVKELISRKSTRAFEDREITSDIKDAILNCACAAPTAGNQQLYTIIDVTDQELKEKLSVTCDKQPFIAKAKMVLVFCADAQKWYDAFKSAGGEPRDPGVGDLMLAVTDATIAAQNAVVAAESMGVGSCYIGDIMENYEIHREMLELPEYVFPCAMLVFGYQTEGQKMREKPERTALCHIVHENTYRHMDAHELREMLSKNARGKSYEEWIKAFCNRKYNSDFSREMTRSTEKYIESFKNKR